MLTTVTLKLVRLHYGKRPFYQCWIMQMSFKCMLLPHCVLSSLNTQREQHSLFLKPSLIKFHVIYDRG